MAVALFGVVAVAVAVVVAVFVPVVAVVKTYKDSKQF